jgi:X breakpoint 2-interacting protein
VKFLATVPCIGFYGMITILPCFLKGITPYMFFHVQSSIVRTCNCIYAMIQQRQRDIEYRETANDTRQR